MDITLEFAYDPETNPEKYIRLCRTDYFCVAEPTKYLIESAAYIDAFGGLLHNFFDLAELMTVKKSHPMGLKSLGNEMTAVLLDRMEE
ncbi:MAG: hypothetical protein ACYC69_00290 [Thermodesulfovibrionales bacterium]